MLRYGEAFNLDGAKKEGIKDNRIERFGIDCGELSMPYSRF